MMEYNKYLVCFLAILIFCGCGVEQDENVYKVDVSEDYIVNISLSDLKRVDFETSSASLLYLIDEVIPYRDGYLVKGREKVLYFNDNGDFLAEVGRKGRGPGEFVMLSSCYVFRDTVHVYSSGMKSVLKYVYDGDEFVYSGVIRTPEHVSMAKLLRSELYPERYFALNTYYGVGGITPTISIYDTDFNLITSSTSLVKDGGFSFTCPFGSNEFGVLFTDYINYTIFQIQADTVLESKFFDFGSYAYPDRYVNYTDVTDVFKYVDGLPANSIKVIPLKMYAYDKSIVVLLPHAMIAVYDISLRKSSIFRLCDDSRESVTITSLNVFGGNVYVALEADADDVDNPPVYVIPMSDIEL